LNYVTYQQTTRNVFAPTIADPSGAGVDSTNCNVQVLRRSKDSFIDPRTPMLVRVENGALERTMFYTQPNLSTTLSIK